MQPRASCSTSGTSSVRVVIAFGPTVDLTTDVTLRRTEFAKARGFVIDGVNLGEVVDEASERRRRVSGERSTPRGGCARRMIP